MDPRHARRVDPGRQYPRAMMYGFFAERTDPPHRPCSSGCPCRPSCLRPPPSPTHSGRRSLGHAVLAALQVLLSGPTTDRASLPTSLPLIGLLTPAVLRRPCQSSWGHAPFFRPVPPANTLVRWVNENAFASIVQARPVPPWADRFIIGVAPVDYGPGLLLMPFGFHLTMDTLPSGVLPRNSTFFPLSGQRGITPAFGYGSPHPGARGTSTLLNNALLSTHYAAVRPLEDVRAGRTAIAFACRPAVLVPNRHLRGLPVLVHEVSRRVWGLRLRRTD